MSEAGPLPAAAWAYSRSLCALLPSAAAALGLPHFTNTLQLPRAEKVCVMMVDGLGLEVLQAKASYTPFLRSSGAITRARCLEAAVPSTTASSLASFGTARPPGEHGLVGYDVLDPQQERVVNMLGGWNRGVDPLQWQPYPTVFEQLSPDVRAVTVSLPAFAQSGLTRAALRGSTFVGAQGTGQRLERTKEQLQHPGRQFVYSYWPELDKAGHRWGVDSPQWERVLEDLDHHLQALVQAAPSGTSVLVTGDHGMVDVPEQGRYDYSQYPQLLAGVKYTAGEPRLVQLHLHEGADPDVVADSWRSTWGSQVWVLSQGQAIERGYFGPVSPQVAARIGDVLVAAAAPVAFWDSRRSSESAMTMVGQHGSLTAAERYVPLMQFSC